MLYQRHIFRQVSIASFSAILLFVLILLTGNAVRDVVRLIAAGQMGLLMFLRVVLMLVPSVIVYAFPLGILTGILIAVGRMSSQNEILLLKTAGVRVGRLSRPIFLLAGLGVVFSLAVNLFYAPRALASYRRELREMVRRDPLKFIRPRVFIRDFSGYILYASDQQGPSLTDFRIWEFDGNGRLNLFLFADRGNFQYDESSDSLQLSLSDGSLERLDLKVHSPTVFFKNFAINLPLGKILGADNAGRKKLKHMDFFELLSARDRWTETGLPLDQRSPSQARRDNNNVLCMLHQHFSMAFSIFAFTILAIPLAMKTNRNETSVNTAIALALGVGYYFITIIFSWFQNLPIPMIYWLQWVPNIALTAIGLRLFNGVCRT